MTARRGAPGTAIDQSGRTGTYRCPISLAEKGGLNVTGTRPDFRFSMQDQTGFTGHTVLKPIEGL